MIFLIVDAAAVQRVCAQSYTLQHVTVVDNGSSKALAFDFSPSLPAYRVTAPDSTEFDLYFTGADVAPSAGLPITRSGLYVSSRTSGNALVIQIKSSASMRMSVRPSSPVLNAELFPLEPVTATTTRTAVQTAGGIVTKVIPLQHARLDEIASLFSTTRSDAQQSVQTTSILSGSPISGAYGGNSLVSTIPGGTLSLDMGNQLGAERITDNVAIDRRLNAVIVTGTPDQVAAIADEIRAVDIPDAINASVKIDAKIFELTESAASALGISFTNNGPTGSASLLAQTLSKPQITATFQAQFFAQVQKGHAKLLSSPNLQTLDGTEASILTGDALPVVTTITYPGNPPTVQQQLQYVNVGVHLQIKPYASSSGFVTSVVLAEVSNVTGFIQGNIPQISQRQAIATVRVADSQPFIIGGLLQDNDIENVSRVPILSSIPILGELFKFKSVTHERTNLYVMIVPHIVRPGP